MDLQKLKAEELAGLDLARLRETEGQVRKEIAEKRMDIYTAQGQSSNQVKKLKKSLARVLTVKNQKLNRKEGN